MKEEKINRFDMSQNEIPRYWYNLAPGLEGGPSTAYHPITQEPMGTEDYELLFPLPIIEQELSLEREIEIPEEVREAYKLYRPTPLIRAVRLERALDTPAHIYYKYEGVSPVGSHKLNSAIPQAYYNKISGTKALTTETGAGQWGSALAMAGQNFEIDVQVFMVRSSFDSKPYRRVAMETFGAQVHASPSPLTDFGRAYLQKDPLTSGSLGIAISEAVEVAAKSGGKVKYGLGSVLNHVLLHQTVIGLEALKQMEMAGEYPDIVIACVGGGSNFAGLGFPFLHQSALEQKKTRFIAMEPSATPSLTRGVYGYDYGDSAGIVPLIKMYTLGHDFIPDPIHSGGLRYHGMAPLVSQLYKQGRIEARAVGQRSVFAAAMQFAKAEGIIPAPESAHAIRGAIDEALLAKESGEAKVILFNLSGHGLLDLSAYERFLNEDLPEGRVEDGRLEGLERRLPMNKTVR